MLDHINRRSDPESFSLGKRLIVAWFLSGPISWILGQCLFRLSGVEGTTPPEQIESTEKWFTGMTAIGVFAAIVLRGHIPFSRRFGNIAAGALAGTAVSFLAVVMVHRLPESWFTLNPIEGPWASELRRKEWANLLGFRSLPITLLLGSLTGLAYSLMYPQHKTKPPIETENEPPEEA